MNKAIIRVAVACTGLLWGAQTRAAVTVQHSNIQGLAADTMLYAVGADGCSVTEISIYGADNLERGNGGPPVHYTGAFVGYSMQNVCTNVWTTGSYFAEPDAAFSVTGGPSLDSAALDCSFDLVDSMWDPDASELRPIPNQPSHRATVHVSWSGRGQKGRYDANGGHAVPEAGTGYSFHFAGSYRTADVEAAVSFDGTAVKLTRPSDGQLGYLYWVQQGDSTVTHL